MNTKNYFFIVMISSLIFTGCQNNDLSAQNNELKQQINELQQQVTELKKQNNISLQDTENIKTEENNLSHESVSSNTSNQTPSDLDVTIYTIEELSAMVDEFISNVGSVTPDVNNSGNLDQFFSLKREGDQLEHALENHENFLEEQYRSGVITREDYRNSDRAIEKLEDLLDSACDRLEITFGIDD